MSRTTARQTGTEAQPSRLRRLAPWAGLAAFALAALLPSVAFGQDVSIDFGDDTITGYNAAGEVVHSAKLPDDPTRVASAVADAVSRL